MIGLKKRQFFSLKNVLRVDFALPLRRDQQEDNAQERLRALCEFGVEQVVFVTDPVTVTETSDKLDIPIGMGIPTINDSLIVETIPSYWLDEAFETFVKQHPLVAYRDKYVLLALRNFGSFRGLKGPVFEIRARGYEPVILHRDPKQYVGIKAAALEYLNDLGCLLQLDLLTLSGAYGAQAKNRAELLVFKRWASVLTTGIHTAEDIVQLHGLTIPASGISVFQHVINQHIQYARFSNE